MCGRLVRISRLNFDASGFEGQYVTWAEKGATGYRVFTDGSGNRITVATSGYASFAGEQVPRREVALTGILMKGNTDTARGVYILKLRSADDVE